MCTTVIVGKKVSRTGRVIVGHNEDSGGRVLHQQFFYPAADHPVGEYLTAEPGAAKIPQVPHTLATYWSNMIDPNGSSFDHGFANEAGVVLCSNGGTDSFDAPADSSDFSGLTEGGIGFLLRRCVGERARTAREGAELACRLIEKYGYRGAARTYTIADKDEAWVIGVVYGRHYAAKRVPDDRVMLISNSIAVRFVDINDKENVIVPDDLVSYAMQKGRYTPAKPGCYDDFDFARAYQSDDIRRMPTKASRMRIGWKFIAGLDCPDDLNFPELAVPLHKMDVNDVKAVLRLTCLDTYAERGDGKADTFHVSAKDVSRMNTRESWVMELAEKPLFNTLWRCAANQDVNTYVPWFPLAGQIPEGYQWTDLETARAKQFCVTPDMITLDWSRSYFTYAQLAEFVNFNRGLLIGITPVRNALEKEYADAVEAVREATEDMGQAEATAKLADFTVQMAARNDAAYKKMLASLNNIECRIEPASLSVADAGTVDVIITEVPGFDVEKIDMRHVLWSLGYTAGTGSVTHSVSPKSVEIRRKPGEERLEAVFTFDAQEVARYGIPGVLTDTYIRGFADFRRFVATAPVLFTE